MEISHLDCSLKQGAVSIVGGNYSLFPGSDTGPKFASYGLTFSQDFVFEVKINDSEALLGGKCRRSSTRDSKVTI